MNILLKIMISISVITISSIYFILKRYMSNKRDHSLLDVNEELNSVLGSLNSSAGINNMEIKYFSTLENKIFIKGNKNKFQQALINLVKTGLHATPKKSIEIAVHEMLNSILIVIEDNGKALSEEQIKQLGKNVQLPILNQSEQGLMDPYQVIGSMSGKIHVSSENGRGTIFSVIIPKAARLKTW